MEGLPPSQKLFDELMSGFTQTGKRPMKAPMNPRGAQSS